MQLLPLLIFIAIAVFNAKRNNDKKAEQARRSAASVREAEQQQGKPVFKSAPRPAYQPKPTAQVPAQRPAPAVAPTPMQPVQGSMVFNSHEGDSSLEGNSAYAPQPQHVVQPLTESKHGHTESSITGIEACPPDTSSDAAQLSHDAAYDIRTSVRTAAVRLNAANIRQAVIFSEVLGKPKALRR